MIDFLWSLYLHNDFFDGLRNKLQTINIYNRVEEDQKFKKKMS